MRTKLSLCFDFVLFSEPRKRHQLQILDLYIPVIKEAHKSSKRICLAAVIATSPSQGSTALKNICGFTQEKSPTGAHFVAKCLLTKEISESTIEGTLEKNHIAVQNVLYHL
jgi:hypothetical protein